MVKCYRRREFHAKGSLQRRPQLHRTERVHPSRDKQVIIRDAGSDDVVQRFLDHLPDVQCPSELRMAAGGCCLRLLLAVLVVQLQGIVSKRRAHNEPECQLFSSTALSENIGIDQDRRKGRRSIPQESVPGSSPAQAPETVCRVHHADPNLGHPSGHRARSGGHSTATPRTPLQAHQWHPHLAPLCREPIRRPIRSCVVELPGVSQQSRGAGEQHSHSDRLPRHEVVQVYRATALWRHGSPQPRSVLPSDGPILDPPSEMKQSGQRAQLGLQGGVAPCRHVRLLCFNH
mmetsp:Transcript_42329/g.100420  ORF Transcript_42329/g.100420 Transcript_42329/m.100420 type:complete len:288 (-) Transcript_42329:310-1173(-)